MRASTLLAVVTLTTTLAVADPFDDPTCPTMQKEMYYNSTTQEVTAISYVNPFTTPTKLSQPTILENENATLTAKLQPDDTESVMYFGGRLPLHVDGISNLTGNPIFGEWVGKVVNVAEVDWRGTNCTWNSVEKYLREGGSGLRLRRENLSTLTVEGWTLATKTHDGTFEKYVAEPSENTNEILVVFTDPVELDISLAQANVVQIVVSSFGALPDVSFYRAAMCTVSRSGIEDLEFFDVGPSLTRETTEMQFRLDDSPSCSGMQILYTTESKPDPFVNIPTPAPTTKTPAPTPSESSAIQLTARLSIALFAAVAPSIFLLL